MLTTDISHKAAYATEQAFEWLTRDDGGIQRILLSTRKESSVCAASTELYCRIVDARLIAERHTDVTRTISILTSFPALRLPFRLTRNNIQN